MNRRALIYLRDMGAVCGAPLGRQFCLLEPGHDGKCDRWFPQRPATEVERLQREVAKLKAQRDRRQRHRESLLARIAMLERQQVRDRGYLGFRIQFRLIGVRNRLRRYWRFAYHRTVRRALGTWPPKGQAA